MKVQTGDRFQDQRFNQLDGAVFEFTGNVWICVDDGNQYHYQVTQFILANYTYIANFSKSRNFNSLYDILND